MEDTKNLKDAAQIDNFPGFKEQLAKAKAEFNSSVDVQDAKSLTFQDDPRVIFLGTGSMMPATYRNVSAISLTVNMKFNVLLDCGEGTFAQLIDSLGSSGVDDYLTNLRVIYITHIHPDHNLGLFKMLSERQRLEKKLGKKFEVRFWS